MQKEKLDFILSIISVSIFVLLLIVSASLLFRIYLKRKNSLLLEKQRMAVQFEQTLLQSKLEIQEQTFADISREIHDNIGQVLSLARINLNTLHVPGDNGKLHLVDELMDKALTDLRNLSHSLDADFIRKKGWVQPVQKLLSDIQKTGKYKTEIKIASDLPALGNDKPIILFRMIQEAVNNIIRHAVATQIWVEAKREADDLAITITDNGKGFNTEISSSGAGLTNLENRSKMINAELQIKSEPGSGTSIIIFVKTTPNE